MRKGGLLLLKTLAKSIREYKLASILSPLFVSFEVILECLMPFVISMLVEVIESSTPTMAEIWKYAGILVAIAVASLVTGTLAGAFCARASTGFPKTCAKTFTITSRTSRLRTSTSSRRLRSSPV